MQDLLEELRGDEEVMQETRGKAASKSWGRRPTSSGAASRFTSARRPQSAQSAHESGETAQSDFNERRPGEEQAVFDQHGLDSGAAPTSTFLTRARTCSAK